MAHGEEEWMDDQAAFADFWPYYLQEHAHAGTRAMHYVGTGIFVGLLAALPFTGRWWIVPAALLAGYGFAWLGHFVFEKNKPASFKRPLYSFLGDWAMYRDIWAGRIRF
jgi:hypothetical protein